MNPLREVRRHLGWKLFITYLVVIAFAGIVLATAAEAYMPLAFSRHLVAMTQRLGDAAALSEDLFTSFRLAMVESLRRAALAATAFSLVLSLYIARNLSRPIRRMTLAARRIADGHYSERVEVNEAAPQDEVGELAVQFNRMAGALERTESTRRELLANVAHELRTPLTGIKGYMEALLDGVLPPEPATFECVHREADRLQRLVYDLQELGRVEAPSLRLELRPLTVEGLIGAAVERLRMQFEDKGVALRTELPADLPPVPGDEDRLAQVLHNVIGNALQYTPPGGQVTISARALPGQVEIAVADNGVGIPAEHLPRIFERFYRVDPSRARAGGGSGIGLTIAGHLVQAHGGAIAAHSDGPGKGSTFTITLPTG